MSDIYNTSSASNTKDFMGDFHDKKLLEVLEEKTQLKQFAIPKTITSTNGITISFHSIDAFEDGTLLSDEYSDPDATGITGDVKTSTVVQFGGKKIISELLEAGAVTSLVEEAQVRFGYAAARTLDKYIQRVLLTGDNPGKGYAASAWIQDGGGSYALSLSAYVSNYSEATQSDTKLKVGCYTTGAVSFSTDTFNVALTASSAAEVYDDNAPTVSSVRDIVTRMKMRDVSPYSDGSYVIVMTPKDAAKLRADDEFQKWNRYNNAEKMFKGEVGMIEGARIVESTNLYRVDTTQSLIDTESYLNFAFGNQCFALSELSGKHGIKSMIVPFSSKDHSNVLERIASIGWKYTGAVAVLDARQGMIIVSAHS